MHDRTHERNRLITFTLNMMQLIRLENTNHPWLYFIAILINDQRPFTFMNNKNFNTLMSMECT
ncbi:hypothetical protein D3C71_1636340 [compost metagenome]